MCEIIKYGKIVEFAHFLIANTFKTQSDIVAVDFTVGKGNDTLFLCDFLKNSGFVYGFDLQIDAIKITNELLVDSGLTNYKLINDCHSNLKSYIKEKIDIAVFNLGYLPGYDKSIITNFETTISAISECLNILSDRGKIYIACYVGHDEGKEKLAIESFVKSLSNKKYNVIEFKLLNKLNNPPELIIIE